MGAIGNAAQSFFPSADDSGPSFLQGISSDFFVWEPAHHRAAAMSRLTRQFWQFNATEALQAAAAGLGESLSQLQESVRQLDVDRTLSPRLSARLSGLMEAIEHRDGYAVYDSLQAWLGDPPDSWYSEELTTESIAMHAWEAAVLREVRSTQISGVSALQFFPVLERKIDSLQAAVAEALVRIGQVDPEMHSEIVSHVSLVKLFTGSGIEGLSTPRAFGSIWLKAPDVDRAQQWFLEHLVHECSHLHLNAMLIADPLLNNPQEINRSPLRPDPRPMFQILHGTFVLARNCRVHARLAAEFPELQLTPALQKFREQLRNGLEVLNQFMQPTAMGEVLLKSLSAAA